MAGSGASSAVMIAEEELASMHQFIENALDLKLKVHTMHQSSMLSITQAASSLRDDTRSRFHAYVLMG